MNKIEDSIRFLHNKIEALEKLNKSILNIQAVYGKKSITARKVQQSDNFTILANSLHLDIDKLDTYLRNRIPFVKNTILFLPLQKGNYTYEIYVQTLDLETPQRIHSTELFSFDYITKYEEIRQCNILSERLSNFILDKSLDGDF